MKRLGTVKSLLRLLTIALVILFSLSLVGTALAETAQETELPVDYTEYNEKQDDAHKVYIGLNHATTPDSNQGKALRTVKNKLEAYGYYAEAGIDTNEVDWYNDKLDGPTMKALRKCLQANDMMDFECELGLTNGAWWAINQDQINDLNNPTEVVGEEYPVIEWQSGDGRLKDLVTKLYDKKYLANMEHSVYDQDVKDALEKFGNANGFPDYYKNDAEGEVRAIEADIQRRLIEEDFSEYVEPKVPYFSRSVEVLGIHTTMLVVWCVGLVVLLGCVLAVIYFFFPSEKKDDKNKKKTVHFEITYNGKTSKSEAEIVKTLKIGRGVGNFPLDLQDMKISRRHCELYYNNDVLMLRDYSANGTTVNGLPVNNAETILTSGSVVVIGDHSIVVTYSA